MEALINQVIEKRYQVQTLLGKGGMGGVFKARDLNLQRNVALKIMRPEFAQDPNFQKRFLQEAQAPAQLDHPGVVKVYDVNHTGDLLYIVMEFIPGTDLQTALERLGQQKQWITLREAIRLIRAIGLALHYMHENHILHRDLKPANIMLKPEKLRAEGQDVTYQPVITDLGLAKLKDSGLTTQIGQHVGGTPSYMSPEQAKGETVDARSDVYSLGLLLYELVVGQRPFPIKSLTDAVRYHIFEPPPPPRTLRADLPPALEKIILRVLAKDPNLRFPSALALVQALDALPTAKLPTTAPASARNGVTDLATLFRQNPPKPSPPTPGPTHDQILVIQPTGATYNLTLSDTEIRVGRSQNNQVVINDVQLAPVQLRIEFDGTNYFVIGQQSTPPTFVANDRLIPGQRTLWLPEKALRLANHQLVLQRGQTPTVTPPPFAPTEPFILTPAQPARRIWIPALLLLGLGAFVFAIVTWLPGFVGGKNLVISAATQPATAPPLLTPSVIAIVASNAPATPMPIPATMTPNLAATQTEQADIVIQAIQRRQAVQTRTEQARVDQARQTVDALLVTSTSRPATMTPNLAATQTEQANSAAQATQTSQAMQTQAAQALLVQARQPIAALIAARQTAVAATQQRTSAPVLDRVNIPLTFQPGQPFELDIAAHNAGTVAQAGSISISLPQGGDMLISDADAPIVANNLANCDFKAPYAMIFTAKTRCHVGSRYVTRCPFAKMTMQYPLAEIYYKPWKGGDQHFIRITITPPSGIKAFPIYVRVAMLQEAKTCNLLVEPGATVTNVQDQQGYPVYEFIVTAAE